MPFGFGCPCCKGTPGRRSGAGQRRNVDGEFPSRKHCHPSSPALAAPFPLAPSPIPCFAGKMPTPNDSWRAAGVFQQLAVTEPQRRKRAASHQSATAAAASKAGRRPGRQN